MIGDEILSPDALSAYEKSGLEFRQRALAHAYFSLRMRALERAIQREFTVRAARIGSF